MGVCGICAKRQKKCFDFVIWGWGKQCEILLVVIGEYYKCRLLTGKTRSRRGLTEQLTFMGRQLSTRVYSVHLVDELVLAVYTLL